jgi:hypothetical protein
MQLTYYNNKSDRRYVDKNIVQISLQDHNNPVDITLINPTNIINPVFKVKDADIYMTANYCYVNDLHRFYFIDDITLDNGYGFLHCSVDVLMTYKEGLRNLEAVVTRQEAHVDFYQNDERYRIEQRTAKRTIAFSGGDASGFDFNNQQFILGVVGDNS